MEDDGWGVVREGVSEEVTLGRDLNDKKAAMQRSRGWEEQRPSGRPGFGKSTKCHGGDSG